MQHELHHYKQRIVPFLFSSQILQINFESSAFSMLRAFPPAYPCPNMFPFKYDKILLRSSPSILLSVNCQLLSAQFVYFSFSFVKDGSMPSCTHRTSRTSRCVPNRHCWALQCPSPCYIPPTFCGLNFHLK